MLVLKISRNLITSLYLLKTMNAVPKYIYFSDLTSSSPTSFSIIFFSAANAFSILSNSSLSFLQQKQIFFGGGYRLIPSSYACSTVKSFSSKNLARNASYTYFSEIKFVYFLIKSMIVSILYAKLTYSISNSSMILLKCSFTSSSSLSDGSPVTYTAKSLGVWFWSSILSSIFNKDLLIKIENIKRRMITK